MTIGITDVLNAVKSKAKATGKFSQVLLHEPDNVPPDYGCAIWVDSVKPVRTSGLASTSVLVIIMLRIYGSGMTEPKDTIDIEIVEALDEMMLDIVGDFQLDGLSNLRQVDIFGAHGTELSAESGYVNSQEMIYRVMTMTIPLVFNDLWDQTA